VKWFLDILELLIAYFSVSSKKDKLVTVVTETKEVTKVNEEGVTVADEVTGVTIFLGDKSFELTGVKGALAGLAAELGGAVVAEARDFAEDHKDSLLSMTKKEMSFLFGKIFKNKGEWDEEAYKTFVDDLDADLLVAEAEANADEMGKLAGSVANKKILAADMKRRLGVLARFALMKAISIASHGVL
jgi:hypothetical protein